MATKKNDVAPIEIEVNMDLFMIDDLEVLDRIARGEGSLSDEIDVFERVVVGGVRGKYKAHEIRNIRKAVLDSLRNAANDPS